jgi:antitoxin (DNA-binding transcriptional repressor) of toxin-antitoxin stability system
LIALPLTAQVSIRSVRVLRGKGTVEIEVESTDRVEPQAQLLTGPNRLVVDFPNAVPSAQLRSQSIDRGEVKDIRVALFQAKPPVTRLVLDLKSAQQYQIFPSGRTVMIKVSDDAIAPEEVHDAEPTRPGLVVTNYTTRAESIHVVTPAVASPVQPALQVTYRDGLLGVHANKATLSEVLYAIQQRTGADISIAAGAEQEKVVAEIEPAPAPEVLARLLNGSKFNFLILSATDDPRRLERVILSTRPDIVVTPLPPSRASAKEKEMEDEDTADDDSASAHTPPRSTPPPTPSANGPRSAAEAKAMEPKASPDDTTANPDQN